MNRAQPVILAVDDEPNNLKLLQQILGKIYILRFANNGKNALLAAEKHKPDLILLDIMMPKMDGYEVCAKLQENSDTAKIPVIFITAKREVEDKEKGLALGAVDYVTKPIAPHMLLARVALHLRLVNRDQAIIESLSSLMRAAKLKDNETANHTLRVAMIAYLIARHLGYDQTTAYYLFLVAPLHDIGKIGVPDEVLYWPGNLREQPDMWQKMQSHTVYGAEIIGTGIRSDLMRMAYNVVRSHHEKLDGSGYPDKLKGDEIPLEALITSVADMIDSMLDPTRPYRSTSVPVEEVQGALAQARDVTCPATIIDAVFLLWDDFMTIEGAFPNEKPLHFESFSSFTPEKLDKLISSVLKGNGDE